MTKVYGHCDAGCKRRVVPYEEFANSAAYVRQHIDETGKFHFEKGKEYKIFAPLDSDGNFTCKIKVLDNYNDVTEIENKNNDEYADSFIFKLLDYFIDEDEVNNIVVYELAGVRYKTAIERTTSLSDGDIASIYVEGATDILLINTDASILAKDGDNAFIRYSASADGTGFTEKWSEGQNYIGFATGQTAPTDKNDYEWVSLGVSEAKKEADRAEAAATRTEELLTEYITDIDTLVGGES